MAINDLGLCLSVAVKFLWPVGGALMQCFKARKPCGDESREEGGIERGREGREGGRRCCSRARMPPPEDPRALNTWLRFRV